MTYRLCVTKNRIPYLKQQLGDKIVVTNEGDGHINIVEVTIKNNMDALSLFHAGVMAGVNADNPVVEVD